MKKHARNLLIAAGSALVCLIFYVYTVANKEGLVIRHHYSGWRTLSTVSTILLALSGALLALVVAIYGYKKWQQKQAARFEEKQAAKREADEIESKKLRTPEDIRQFFIDICKARPHCQIAKMIKDQLDEMNEYQARFEKLLEVNNFQMAADNIRKVLQDAEDSICDDCRSAINAYIIDEEAGFEAAAKTVYDRNEFKLGKVKEFLDKLKAYASGKVTSDDAIQNLEIFGEAISASTNKEDF